MSARRTIVYVITIKYGIKNLPSLKSLRTSRKFCFLSFLFNIASTRITIIILRNVRSNAGVGKPKYWGITNKVNKNVTEIPYIEVCCSFLQYWEFFKDSSFITCFSLSAFDCHKAFYKNRTSFMIADLITQNKWYRIENLSIF